MALEWMLRDDGQKDRLLHSDMHWGLRSPGTAKDASIK